MARGFEVFAGCLTADGVKELERETNAAARLHAFVLDVSKPADVQACAERVRAHCPKGLKYARAPREPHSPPRRERAHARRAHARRCAVHAPRTPRSALVNNAGIAAGFLIEWSSIEDFRRNMEVNYLGGVQMTLAHLPLLRQAARARIVNVASVAGFATAPGMAGYVASKHAVEGFSDVLRLELKAFKIPVSIIEPAFQRTNIIRGLDQQFERAFNNGKRHTPQPAASASATATRSRTRAPYADRRAARTPAAPAEVQETYGREYMEKSKLMSVRINRIAISPQFTVDAMMYAALGEERPRARTPSATARGHWLTRRRGRAGAHGSAPYTARR